MVGLRWDEVGTGCEAWGEMRRGGIGSGVAWDWAGRGRDPEDVGPDGLCLERCLLRLSQLLRPGTCPIIDLELSREQNASAGPHTMLGVRVLQYTIPRGCGVRDGRRALQCDAAGDSPVAVAGRRALADFALHLATRRARHSELTASPDALHGG